MTSGSVDSSAARRSFSVSTRCSEKSSCARRSSRSIRAASCGLSSTIRMRMCWAIDDSGSRLVHCHPVETEVGDGLHEAVELDRLHDIAVHAELITFHPIALLGGRSDHHDGDSLCPFVALRLPQHLDAVDL